MAHSINSLVWATDVDVLAPDHTLERRDGYWVVQSPSNPTFWWGNFLLFDDAPLPGDGERWEQLFAQAFAERPDVTHRTFAWDTVDGQTGAAEDELAARGFELERSSGLIARSDQIREHARANREVEVRALDPEGDEPLWAAVLDVQMGSAPEEFRETDYHLTFMRRRQQEHRTIFRGGRGSWYVALLDGAVAGSLGVVVTDRRARYQTVDTAEAFRRRGIASRLVVDAARDAMSKHPIDNFVIVADPDYHAIGIYEDLGFERVERVVGAMRKPAGA
jgi:ribosomal protein S18 acetylase RimI-like enzyme